MIRGGEDGRFFRKIRNPIESGGVFPLEDASFDFPMKAVVHPNLKANPAPAAVALGGGLASKHCGVRPSARIAKASSNGARWMGLAEAAG